MSEPLGPELVKLLGQAACLRIAGLLLEEPGPAWAEELEALRGEVPYGPLCTAAQRALREASSELYFSVAAPAGPLSFREATYRDSITLGNLLSELRGLYEAFGYKPVCAEPPDHAAVQLGFASFLRLKEVFLYHTGEKERAQRLGRFTVGFVCDHPAKVLKGVREAGGAQADNYLGCAVSAACSYLEKEFPGLGGEADLQGGGSE